MRNNKYTNNTNTKKSYATKSHSKPKTAKTKSTKKLMAVVVKKFGVVGTKNGADLELRLVKWVPEGESADDVDAKFDIRTWYTDDKGIEHANKAPGTFTAAELKALMAGLKKFAKEVK